MGKHTCVCALMCACALAPYYYYPLPYSPFSFHRLAGLKRKNRGSAWRFAK
nr:MAG TPA: hypothetical protein [Caudoviricetes sp.]